MTMTELAQQLSEGFVRRCRIVEQTGVKNVRYLVTGLAEARGWVAERRNTRRPGLTEWRIRPALPGEPPGSWGDV
jgi:hypothetical protein